MIVVADAGPLIVFGRSGHLGLLRQVASEVVVSKAVFEECTVETHKPGAIALKNAAQDGIITVHENVSEKTLHASADMLDIGERSALALAMHLQCPVLMDERIGRSVAQINQIPVIGSLGMLVLAKQRGLIEKIAPVLGDWQTYGYFISSELKAQALELAGEKVS